MKNAIFVGQGSIIKPFYEIILRLKKEGVIDRAGLFVSSSIQFDEFTEQYPDYDQQGIYFLKEWEITGNLKNKVLNEKKLKDYEDKIADPTLWNAAFLDRRLIYGPDTKIKQDYRKRFSHEEIKKIIYHGCKEVEAMIDKVKPDVIISFVPAVFSTYLFKLFADYKKIKFYKIKSTKIENFITLTESIFENYENVNFLTNNPTKIPSNLRLGAKEYLKKARAGNSTYEGVVIKKSNSIFYKLGLVLPFIRRVLKYYFVSTFRKDNYNAPGPLFVTLYSSFLIPLKKKIHGFRLRNHVASMATLKHLKFVYFPLATEPEISLNLYSRPYTNQIEVIRNIALNIPIGHKLVVKDHPRSLGVRNFGYYKKLLDIPNVVLADSNIKSVEISKISDLTIVLSGFSGFEALIHRKPVITLGNCNYNTLSFVSNVTDLYELGNFIKAKIGSSDHIEEELENFIAAIMHESFRVNIYGGLLKADGYDSEKSTDFNALYENVKNKMN